MRKSRRCQKALRGKFCAKIALKRCRDQQGVIGTRHGKFSVMARPMVSVSVVSDGGWRSRQKYIFRRNHSFSKDAWQSRIRRDGTLKALINVRTTHDDRHPIAPRIVNTLQPCFKRSIFVNFIQQHRSRTAICWRLGGVFAPRPPKSHVVPAEIVFWRGQQRFAKGGFPDLPGPAQKAIFRRARASSRIAAVK